MEQPVTANTALVRGLTGVGAGGEESLLFQGSIDGLDWQPVGLATFEIGSPYESPPLAFSESSLDAGVPFSALRMQLGFDDGDGGFIAEPIVGLEEVSIF